jgi:hypothetical protein
VGDLGVDWRNISKLITDFMVSEWLITDVNPVLGLLHRVVVGNVPIFRRYTLLPSSYLDSEDEGNMYLRYVGNLVHNHAV